MSAPHPTTLDLLRETARGAPAEVVALADLLQRFRERAFGVLLLAATLPAFIPLPFGVGAVAGPLVMLVGLQLLLAFHQPWLPRRLRDRGPRRETVGRFLQRSEPLFRRMERLVRPRWEGLVTHPLALCLTGALLLALGFLLALPIPFTNYPFGLLLLVYCVALIERDGLLLSIGWLLGGGVIGGFLLASEAAAGWVGRMLG